MTNEEKFKTPEERARAHRDFCRLYECLCGCPLAKSDDCAFSWLALEAEEEPMPCPFCGEHTHTDHSMHDDYSVWCDHCGYKSTVCKSKDDAIAAHNRMCRSVKADKEGGAK